jgi:hypothetical protein
MMYFDPLLFKYEKAVNENLSVEMVVALGSA